MNQYASLQAVFIQLELI